MWAVIISVMAIIAGIIISVFAFDEDSKQYRFYPVLGAIVLSAILLIIASVAVVPTGHTGILTTFGAVEDRQLNAGANIKAPWQNVVRMDNRTQKVQLTTSAFSSDTQQVDIQMSVNYSIDQATARILYRTVGKDYYNNVMYPRILENTKAVFSKYSADTLIATRDILSEQIRGSLASEMEEYGIIVIAVSVEDVDFTDAYTNAVEAKQVAQQNKLTAETQQAQKTMEEKASAERAIIAAQADADKAIIAANADLEVKKVQADADLYTREKEAEANNKVAKSITSELITYYWVQAWDGKVPETFLGADGNFMIGVG